MRVLFLGGINSKIQKYKSGRRYIKLTKTCHKRYKNHHIKYHTFTKNQIN